MKQEKSKPTKKKILTYYLILAASLLVIAAITVGVIFAVRGNSVTPPDSIIDNNPSGGNQDNNDNNPGNTGDDNKPNSGDNQNKPVNSDSAYVFITPVKDVNLTQAHVFGYDKTLDRYRFHEGMDFNCAAGTDVLAAVDGTVKSISTKDVLYGAVITVEHADGVTTVYKFIDPEETLKVGDKVSQGSIIGTVAVATGVENAEGDHLHFEVYKNNIMQDPDDYLDILSK